VEAIRDIKHSPKMALSPDEYKEIIQLLSPSAGKESWIMIENDSQKNLDHTKI